MKFDISDNTPLGFKPNLFKKLNREEQIEFMRDWFYERYEDPAQRTPYISAEGGYQYIYGGPFDAEEVLRDNFEAEARKGTIEELADELSNECSDWTYTAQAEDYEDYDYDYLAEFDNIVQDYELILRLSVSLDTVNRIVAHSKKLDKREQEFSNMMNFSFCITLLETYLSEAFIRSVMKNDEIKAKYLKNERKLSSERFSLGELFEKHETIDKIIKKQVTETSFHNFPHIKSLFASVLNIDLGDIEDLVKFVDKRHDFVHRGGKNTAGENVSTNSEEIGKLIESIKRFSSQVDGKLVSSEFLQGSPF